MTNAPAVLVVDDDDLLTEMLQDLLSESGYEVLTARTASEALDVLTRTPTDVVLTDLNLADESGFEILGALAERAPGTVGVLMSAFLDSETDSQARQLGTFATLRKPFGNEELLGVVRAAVERASTDSPSAPR